MLAAFYRLSDPPADAGASVIAERARRAFGALPVDQRIPIRLVLERRMTYRQVANELGVPEAIVLTRIRGGLQSLRRSGNPTGHA